MDITFENIDEIRQHTDPKVFSQAVGSTVRRLSDRAATLISKEVRKDYPVKARTIADALTKKFNNNAAIPERLLIYTATRISLSKYATGSPRPVVMSSRGRRYGARVKDRKGMPPRIVPGAFWGTAQTSGSEQIFSRKTRSSNSKIKKLTGPSVSQMVRGTDVLDAIQKHVEDNATNLLRQNLDHFQKRRIGIR